MIGGLYEKYDDTEQIEPLPFDAETLLNTSFQFHDEFVMTGGKDIDTLGLDLHTGQVHIECVRKRKIDSVFS